MREHEVGFLIWIGCALIYLGICNAHAISLVESKVAVVTVALSNCVVY